MQYSEIVSRIAHQTLFPMWKQLQMGLRAFLLIASRVWTCLCYTLKKQTRAIIQHQSVKYDIFPLSPLSWHRLTRPKSLNLSLDIVKRKVLVLDLDETLIHSHHDGVVRQTVRPGTPPDFVLKVVIDRHPVRFFVHKRPHVDFFLDIVSQWYELVVFTASMEIYGAAVADKLDAGRGILQRRFYRQHCTPDLGSYTKDLSAICNDLSSVFILDNSPGAYRAYPGRQCDTDKVVVLGPDGHSVAQPASGARRAAFHGGREVGAVEEPPPAQALVESRNRSDMPVNSVAFSKISRNESTDDLKVVDQVDSCVDDIVTQVQEIESPAPASKQSGKKIKTRAVHKGSN
ncbi:hypothetical protein NQ315_011726 [Exocentrus adspersus]|uniref:FCP1 homology domain-containing protein n=1 Tax=Exocentrus adspersus TaxID=1586481 RepID=A0AAV8W088_9CUCU|nr:hypothetical protein NQ315_011726 [Exocentrus adspersus]